jgi:hypothetical protein
MAIGGERMRSIIFALALAVLLQAVPALADIEATTITTVSVVCWNFTADLYTNYDDYGVNDTAEMALRIVNGQNESINETVMIELFDSNYSMVRTMAAQDINAAPGNESGGVSWSYYYNDFDSLDMANYTMRARLVERDLFHGQNVTLIGCWVEPIYSNNRTITLNAGRPNPPTNINATLNTTTGDIIIVWTPSNSSNVYDYVIYATDNYTQGFNFSDPYATVPNTSSNWTDFLANSTDERYYLIKANNTVGMEDRDYFVIGKFNLKMYTGWSLFSLPLKPWNQDINSIIYTGTQDDQMWRYDANDTGDH